MPKTLRGILEELAYSFYGGEKISKKKTNQVINTIEKSIDQAQKDIEGLKTCEHETKDELRVGCIWCELAWYKKYVEKLEAQQKKMGGK